MAAISDLASRWPATAHLEELDVCNQEQVFGVVAAAVRVFGRIDVLVNNAGYGLVGALEEGSMAQIRRNFEVNFFGALELIRCALPYFRAAKKGHVLNVSAAAAITNYAGFGAYGAAKSALEGASESLALEGRTFGLRVTIVQPGPFRTDFISRSLERAEGAIAEYEGSAGKFSKFIAGMDGKQPGDPVLAARAMLDVVDAERPPLRLVLGQYALEKVRRSLSQRETELKLWESVGKAADGPAS
jgi:NAD(P)-dependent dehydrogenase (short-subunit alcohol dehydrogenase family)